MTSQSNDNRVASNIHSAGGSRWPCELQPSECPSTMSWSPVARAALQRPGSVSKTVYHAFYCYLVLTYGTLCFRICSQSRLPSPHLRFSFGLNWHDVSVDGEDKLKLGLTSGILGHPSRLYVRAFLSLFCEICIYQRKFRNLTSDYTESCC